MGTSSQHFGSQRFGLIHLLLWGDTPWRVHLFYALSLATCQTRRTGWLANVFLGVAATYAGTATLQGFILITIPAKPYSPSCLNPTCVVHVLLAGWSTTMQASVTSTSKFAVDDMASFAAAVWKAPPKH
ncbi:hypothetical protein BJX64DRAFT_79080 [Aspergillus heterothallicus]